jgi:hypothetical protein
MEQPVWDQQNKEVLHLSTGTVTNPNGEVDEIDPKAMKVTAERNEPNRRPTAAA